MNRRNVLASATSAFVLFALMASATSGDIFMVEDSNLTSADMTHIDINDKPNGP